MTKADGLPRTMKLQRDGRPCIGCSVPLLTGDWAIYHYDLKGFYCTNCEKPPHLASVPLVHFGGPKVIPGKDSSPLPEAMFRMVVLSSDEFDPVCEGRLLKGQEVALDKKNGRYLCPRCHSNLLQPES